MRLAHVFALGAALSLTAGCTYHDRHAGYGATPVYRGEVISTPPPPVTTPARPEPTQGAAAATTPSLNEADRMLAADVRRSLNSQPTIAAWVPDLRINAERGTVTLTGPVPNDADRLFIANVARNTPGVARIVDQMHVQVQPTGRVEESPRVYAPGPAPAAVTPGTMAVTGEIFSLHVQGLNDTDRQMAQRILEGLREDTVLPTLLPRVEINVANGQATLRGTVQSEQQRQSIISAVQRAAGVNNVQDELQIDNRTR